MDTSTQAYIALLESNQRLSEAELQSAQEAYQALTANQAQALSGTLYRINLEAKSLQVLSYPAQDILAEIPLYATPESEELSLDHWELWGKKGVALSQRGQLEAQVTYEDLNQTGLLYSEQGCFIYGPQFDSEFEVIPSHCWWDPRTLKKVTETGPYDLCISESGQFVFVTDRWAGTLLVVCGKEYIPLSQVKIRSEGSSNAIHLAVDEAHHKVYITDNETSSLKVLDLEHFKLSALKPRLGLLGNVCLEQDPRYLYLVSIKPKPTLVYFDTETFEVIKRIPLDNSLLSEDSDLPFDPLFTLGKGKYLLLVTYTNTPKPFTPVIKVFRTDKVKQIRQYALEDIDAPWVYGHLVTNPFYRDTLDFKAFLIQKGLAQESDFEEVEAPPSPEANEVSPYELMMSDEDDNTPLPEQVPLPDEAADEIFDILMSTVFQQTGLELSEHPVECQKLKKLSEQLVEALEMQPTVLVRRPKFFFHRYDLKTTLHRDAILTMIELRRDIEDAPLTTPPVNCPRCRARLLGSWQCTVCGFLLQSPEFAHKRRNSSAEADSFAIPGQILLPLAAQNRVVLLNQDFELLWELQGEALGLKSIVDARYFPRKTVLLTDQESSRVLEVNPQGKILWEVSAKFQLKNPLKATFYRSAGHQRILILEKHRILEIDRRQNLLWSYEASDPEADFRDVHRSYQEKYIVADAGLGEILEITPEAEFPKKLGVLMDLQSPHYVRRLFNNNLLIVDTGREEIYELKPDGKLTQKVRYQNDHLEKEFQIESPVYINHQLQGELLLADHERLLGILHSQQRIQWSLGLDTLSLKRDTLKFEAKDTQLPQVEDYHMSFLASLPVFQGLGDAAWKALADALVSYSVLKGTRIIKAGETGNSLFIILKGEAAVLKDDKNTVLASLQAGDIFGEMSLFLQEPRNSTVRAESACQLLRLDINEFKQLAIEHPAVLKRIKALAFERKRMRLERKTYKDRLAIDHLKARLALRKLKRIDVFASLPEAAFEQLYPTLQLVAYRRNQAIFNYGDPAQYLYFINRGQITVTSADGEDIATLKEGEVFGEIALLHDRTRSAATHAKTYCEVYLLHRQEFEKLYPRYPQLKDNLAKLAEKRIHQDEKRAQDTPQAISHKSAPDVFASTYSVLNETHSFALWNSDLQVPWYYGPDESVQLNFPTQWHLHENTLLIADYGNHRVLAFDQRKGELLAEYGDDQLSLSFPKAAWSLGHEHLLIADQGYQRIIEVKDQYLEEVRWEFQDPQWVLSPSWVCLTPHNTVLFADEELHHVVEVNEKKEVLWHFGESLVYGKESYHLHSPGFVSRLANGNTLIADTGNNRVLEVSPEKKVVWSFAHEALKAPCRVRRLNDEHTLIHSHQQTQIMIVSSSGELLSHSELRTIAPQTPS